jgi:hypothetical protein
MFYTDKLKTAFGGINKNLPKFSINSDLRMLNLNPIMVVRDE